MSAAALGFTSKWAYSFQAYKRGLYAWIRRDLHIGTEEKESEREPESDSLKTNVSSNSSVIKNTVTTIALRSQQIFNSY